MLLVNIISTGYILLPTVQYVFQCNFSYSKTVRLGDLFSEGIEVFPIALS